MSRSRIVPTRRSTTVGGSMFDIVDMAVWTGSLPDVPHARTAASAPKSAVNFLYMGLFFTFGKIE
jgi:hypothetical protein